MNISGEVIFLINQAAAYAKKEGYEDITPELLLLIMLEDAFFADVCEECGADMELLRTDLKGYLKEYMEQGTAENPQLSEGVRWMLQFAGQSAYNSQNKEIGLKHMLHALWNLQESYAVYYMQKQGLTEAELLQEFAILEEEEENLQELSQELQEEETEEEEPAAKSWMLYAPCLNDTLKDVNPLIGREAELERTIQILCRKDKHNPLHIGEPGVGKTAITYGLVQKIREKQVPKELQNARIFALDLGGMLAGTQYRGDFEKRFKKVLAEIGKEEAPVIYIDEIHNLAGAGAVGEGSFDASNLLKPYLTGGQIRFIGATTFEEYKKYVEKNKSLVRRFQNIEIAEPDVEESVAILEGLKQRYESYHGVKYAKGVIDYAVRMSDKHIHERYLPDKAIDLIDEAGAYRKLHPTTKKVQTVDKDVINNVLTKICRVPVETVAADDLSGLKTLEKRLKSRIFGQDEAISQVVNAVKFSKAGLTGETKPLASLLFVGPTGVGKTEIARSLAQEQGVKLIRFDMSEYGEKHAVAKLIGSPAGYVGYDDGGLLTEAIRKNPSCVLLLDEIEKAHADIYNILLQVMDYATLTDNQGRKADFKNVTVIMTSNAGASLIGKGGIGFLNTAQDSSVIMDTVKNTFQPEFRNRLDKIVVFNAMDEKMASLVVEKKLKELAEQLQEKKILFEADQKAKDLLRKKGISIQYGAREVDRVIRNEIKPLFVDEILFGKLKKGGEIRLTAMEENFVLKKKETR